MAGALGKRGLHRRQQADGKITDDFSAQGAEFKAARGRETPAPHVFFTVAGETLLPQDCAETVFCHERNSVRRVKTETKEKVGRCRSVPPLH